MPDLARRLAVARGDELADVVIEGGLAEQCTFHKKKKPLQPVG